MFMNKVGVAFMNIQIMGISAYGLKNEKIPHAHQLSMISAMIDNFFNYATKFPDVLSYFARKKFILDMIKNHEKTRVKQES